MQECSECTEFFRLKFISFSVCVHPRGPVHGQAAQGGHREEGVSQDDLQSPPGHGGGQGGRSHHRQDPQQPRGPPAALRQHQRL